MVGGYRRNEGLSGFPWLFDELGYQGCILETNICVAGREAEGLFDNIERKGKIPIPLRGNKSALMYIKDISEPGDEINTRMDLRGDLVV